MASEVAWETCREPGCIGVGVGDTASCWAHLGPADRDRLIATLGREGQVDARGVRFEDPSLLEALLRECGRGTGTLLSPRFDRAQFAHPVDFSSTSFAGPASFRHSTFSGDAVFRDAVFGGDALFEGAALEGRADFDGVAFHGKALFGGAHFASRASFAGKREVSFAGWADFTQARFGALAWFGGARFGSRVMFEGMHCDDVLRMEGAVLAEACSFGPVVGRAIELDRSQFRSPLRLELSCQRLTLAATQFFERTTVAVRWAEIVMNEAEFGRPSLLTASEPFADGGDELDESRCAERRGAATAAGHGSCRSSEPTSASSPCPASTSARAGSSGRTTSTGCASRATASSRRRRTAAATRRA